MSEEPPFTYCGVDLFGSFLVKDGRKEVKRYGAQYTCLSSRAIHIEAAFCNQYAKKKFTLHNVFQIVHFLLKFGFNLPPPIYCNGKHDINLTKGDS